MRNARRYTILFALAASLQASGFDYPDFSRTEGLSLVKAAKRHGAALRVVPAKQFQTGGVWRLEKQTIGAGFETTFRFQLTEQDTFPHFEGADGLAFVIQSVSPKVTGSWGSAGGFARGDGRGDPKKPGIPRSLAVFFDTYQNVDQNDPSGNYLAICTNGALGAMDWPPRRLAYTSKLVASFKDGAPHTVRIVSRPPLLQVYFDDLKAPVLTAAIDVKSISGAAGAVYVGFTAATGHGFQNHDLLNWKFESLTPDVKSDISSVDSSISFLKTACLPDRVLCTPDQAIVEEGAPGRYHIVLPANLEWGASIPNPGGAPVSLINASGNVCWDPRERNTSGCNGPSGSASVRPDFLVPDQPAGALVLRTRDGRTSFSVNAQPGSFAINEGFFEFDVVLK